MVIMVEFARTTWRSRRTLARFDLAAIMTFILGLSVALAAMRELSILEKIVAGVVVVPASLACASVARIFIEDLWWCFPAKSCFEKHLPTAIPLHAARLQCRGG